MQFGRLFDEQASKRMGKQNNIFRLVKLDSRALSAFWAKILTVSRSLQNY